MYQEIMMDDNSKISRFSLSPKFYDGILPFKIFQENKWLVNTDLELPIEIPN